MLNFFGPTQGIVKRHLVSFRKQRAAAPVSTVFTTTTAVMQFSEDIAGGDETGFTGTVNAIANIVVSVIRTGFGELTLTWTTPGVSTNAVVINYDGSGAWVTVVGGDALRAFQINGVIP